MSIILHFCCDETLLRKAIPILIDKKWSLCSYDQSCMYCTLTLDGIPLKDAWLLYGYQLLYIMHVPLLVYIPLVSTQRKCLQLVAGW